MLTTIAVRFVRETRQWCEDFVITVGKLSSAFSPLMTSSGGSHYNVSLELNTAKLGTYLEFDSQVKPLCCCRIFSEQNYAEARVT